MEILLISDRRLRPMERIWEHLPGAARAGLTGLMIREKDLPGGTLLGIAREAVARCRPLGIRVLINDRIDVALAAGADGVHLGVVAIPVEAARSIAGRRLTIGASTHSLEELAEAARGGADYATFGPVFETPSKEAYGPPLGVGALRAAASSAPLPVLALGGVTPETAKRLAGSGIAGVAAISAILLADDPERAVREIAGALSGAHGELRGARRAAC